MGDTREIWFINAGLLYEVTTYKQRATWLVPIMQTVKSLGIATPLSRPIPTPLNGQTYPRSA